MKSIIPILLVILFASCKDYKPYTFQVFDNDETLKGSVNGDASQPSELNRIQKVLSFYQIDWKMDKGQLMVDDAVSTDSLAYYHSLSFQDYWFYDHLEEYSISFCENNFGHEWKFKEEYGLGVFLLDTICLLKDMKVEKSGLELNCIDSSFSIFGNYKTEVKDPETFDNREVTIKGVSNFEYSKWYWDDGKFGFKTDKDLEIHWFRQEFKKDNEMLLIKN